jgi:small subunit ribosomal protein S17e
LDRIRRISTELIERYPEAFTADFDKNKEMLGKLTVVQSKMVRNQVAGYISKMLKTGSENQEIVGEVRAE